MITKLHVENFKSLRELDVEFGQLAVIVGPNGCGKSSILQAIQMLRDLYEPEDDEARFTTDCLSRTSTGHVRSASISLVSSGERFELGLAPSSSDANLLMSTSSYDHLLSDVKPASIELYRLDRRIMEQPAYTEEAKPTLGPNGENLAEVLDALHGDQPERFEELEATLARMVPGFKRLRVPRRTITRTNRVLINGEFHSGKDSAIGHQVVFDFDHARGIVAEQASEGTLLLLGLLTILATHEGPMTMMLDDLDRALHPKAQKQLVEHLRELLAARPDLQILATSHSPYLVEHLDYAEVLAMTQSPDDGSSHIAPLLSHPDAERWREEMSAGEFWSSVGEDWVREPKAG